MRNPIEKVAEHPAEKDKKGGSAGGDAPVCRMKAAVRKNTQYFRKNTQYFRFSCQYVCLYGPPDDVKGKVEWMWTYGAKSNQQVRERWTC